MNIRYFGRGKQLKDILTDSSSLRILTVEVVEKLSQLTEEAGGVGEGGGRKHFWSCQAQTGTALGRDPSPSPTHWRRWNQGWVRAVTPGGARNLMPRGTGGSGLQRARAPPGAPDWVRLNQPSPSRSPPGKLAEPSAGYPVLAWVLKWVSFVLETTDFRSSARRRANFRLGS